MKDFNYKLFIYNYFNKVEYFNASYKHYEE